MWFPMLGSREDEGPFKDAYNSNGLQLCPQLAPIMAAQQTPIAKRRKTSFYSSEKDSPIEAATICSPLTVT